MICKNCVLGKVERMVGNGITEPPYIWLIRCPFEKKYYKYPDDECCHKNDMHLNNMEAEKMKPDSSWKNGLDSKNIETEKINPCPCCEETKYLIIHNRKKNTYIECAACGIHGPIIKDDTNNSQKRKGKAVIAWNLLNRPANDRYIEGIKYAIYEIMKEADIPGSQEIRDSCDTDDGMCARVAKRICKEMTIPEDNTPTPKEQADMINNYKQMSQALEKQKEQNVQMRKMLDRLKKALGVACSMQLDRILPSDIKAVVNIVLQESEKYDSTLVEGLCCDCFYDKKGFCGDYSENDNCPYKKKDGSCWKPHK